MKSFGLVVLVVLAVSTFVNCKPGLTMEQFSQITAISKKCRETTGATIDQMLKIVAGEYEDEPKLKNQLSCILKNLGLQDDTGKWNVPAVEKRLNGLTAGKMDTEELMKSCVVEKATSAESAYDALKCLFTTKGINLLG